MQKTTQINLLVYVLAGFIFLSGIYLQTQLFFNDDMAWLLHAGQRLLAGGNYYDDFFEVNPPMSIFIYLPAVFIKKFFQLNLLTSARVYIFILAAFSWIFCSILQSKLIITTDLKKRSILLLTIITVYVFLPGGSFGEREYISVLLILPYVFILTAFCQHEKVHKIYQLIACIFAGIGFIIKPYYLLIWIVWEIYIAVRHRTLKICWRWENFLIASVVFLYLITIFLVTPEFIFKVLPAFIDFYYAAYHVPLTVLLSQPLMGYWFFCMIIYLTLRKNLVNPILNDLLFLVSLGFFIINLIQRENWYYHILPALMFTVLLLVTLTADYFSSFFSKSSKSLQFFDYLMAASLAALLLLALAIIWPVNRNVLYKDAVITKQVVSLLKQQRQDDPIKNNLVFFSNEIFDTYPLVDYAGWNSYLRFPSMWIIAYFADEKNLPINSEEQKKFIEYKKLFIHLTVTDLIKNPPRLIILFADDPKDRRVFLPIDYLTILATDPRFDDFWKHYFLQQRLGALAIYQRKN